MNKNKKIVLTLCVLVVLVIIVGILNSNRGSKQKNHITVGVIVGLTGQYAAIGEAVKNGIDLSLKNDPNISVIYEDGQWSPVQGLNAYKKLTSVDKVDVVIGAESFAFPSIAPLVHESGVPYLQLFESSIHEDDSIFQIMPFSYPLFSSLGKAAGEHYSKVAMVYSGASDLFQTDADYFKKGIATSSLVYEDKVISNSDYRTDALKVINSGAQAYTIMMPLEDGIKYINAINQQKGNKKIDVICDANVELALQQYVKGVGAQALQGCLSTNLPTDTSSSFKVTYKQAYGTDPIFGADWGYDAGEIIKKLVNQPKSVWISTIQNLKFDGASGHLAFDATGTRFGESVLRKLVGNSFMDIGSTTVITN